MLDMLQLCCQVDILGSGGTPELTPTIHSAIVASIDAEFARLSAAKQLAFDNQDARYLRELAKEVRAMAATERRSYAPILQRFVPTAEGVALSRIHWAFG